MPCWFTNFPKEQTQGVLFVSLTMHDALAHNKEKYRLLKIVGTFVGFLILVLGLHNWLYNKILWFLEPVSFSYLQNYTDRKQLLEKIVCSLSLKYKMDFVHLYGMYAYCIRN